MQKVLKEAKWRIPCFDQIFTISQRQRTKTSSNAVPGYRELRHRVDMYPNDLEEELKSQACQAYVIAMEHLHNRKPFIPSEGYVRLVPAHSRPGDIVCIIFGADVPFVLRDVGEGEYQLIGEAYVFGIMDGEFVKGDSREEIFCLC
jgi:hypothetical protein